jgi:hypothetical protein
MFDLYAKRSNWVSYSGWVGFCAVLALAIYSYSIATGLAGTFDSYHYLYAAQSLRHLGHLFIPVATYRAWPPLFPVVLNLIGAPRPVVWLNGVAMLGSLLAWSAVGRQVLPPRRTWALPLLLALSSPTLVVSKFIWSEPLFDMLWAGYFLVLLTWLHRGGKVWGMLSTFIGCLMPLQRIAGVFLLAGVGMGLAWPDKRRSVRPNRWAQLAHFLGTSCGIVLWQLHLRSSLMPAKLGSIKSDEATPLLASLADYGFVLGRWLVPFPVTSLHILPVLLWVIILGLFLWLLKPRLLSAEEKTQAITPNLSGVSSRMLFMALVISICFLVTATMFERIGSGMHEAERYLTPLYPPVIVLVLLAWPIKKRWAMKLGPGFLIIWTLYQGIRVGHNAFQLRQLSPAEADVNIHRLLNQLKK